VHICTSEDISLPASNNRYNRYAPRYQRAYRIGNTQYTLYFGSEHSAFCYHPIRFDMEVYCAILMYCVMHTVLVTTLTYKLLCILCPVLVTICSNDYSHVPVNASQHC